MTGNDTPSSARRNAPRTARTPRQARPAMLSSPTLAVTCLLGDHGVTAVSAADVTFVRRTPQDPPADWSVITWCPGCGPSLLVFRPAARPGTPAVTPLTALYARLATAGARVIDVPAGPARDADVIPLVLPGGAA